jgi:dihydrofolate synthase/folylpolyglutamate synthase
VATPDATYDVTLPVLGGFQRRNAATAILALEKLQPHLRPSVAEVEQGLAELVLPGRMEYFPGFPGIVFDVAHNPDKAESLAEALRTNFPDRRFAFVVAISESKDAAGVLRPWLDLPATFVFTAFETAGRESERPGRLANIAERAGAVARTISDPIEALTVARRQAEGSHLIVVTGSTFLTGMLREWWIEHVFERLRN